MSEDYQDHFYCQDCGAEFDMSADDLEEGDWHMHCPECDSENITND